MVLAVRLMWAGAALAALGVVVTLLTLGTFKDNVRDQLAESDSSLTESDIDTAFNLVVTMVLIFGILGVGLWLWMAWKNGNGRSWARIVATVLGGINIAFTLLSLVQGTSPGLSVLLSLLSLALAVTILVLIWRKESTAFYQARSRPQYG